MFRVSDKSAPPPLSLARRAAATPEHRRKRRKRRPARIHAPFMHVYVYGALLMLLGQHQGCAKNMSGPVAACCHACAVIVEWVRHPQTTFVLDRKPLDTSLG